MDKALPGRRRFFMGGIKAVREMGVSGFDRFMKQTKSHSGVFPKRAAG
ncbi:MULTISPECIES: hypothetical protein [unclassified Pseudomonas]|nr:MULTISPECIES: hypothetical protein [unclassified Pseudomonas]MEB0047795.1 hypothetical protein [Pseudomonas sp. Dout3]MEB0098286.1 hypothetical protein [Pseudomonas sp. DC1.2]WPX59243.1 hypothetical protein RHM68_00855 [Pseudomonas sp. DC1.2]